MRFAIKFFFFFLWSYVNRNNRISHCNLQIDKLYGKYYFCYWDEENQITNFFLH